MKNRKFTFSLVWVMAAILFAGIGVAAAVYAVSGSHEMAAAGGSMLPFLLFGMAVTAEPNLREASSAYRDLPFEDMLDLLDMYEPAMTPLFTMAAREKELGNTEFSSQVDSWNNPQGAIGYGDTYALQDVEIMDVTANRRKVGNGGQGFRQGYGAGWIAEQVPKLPGEGKGGIIKTGATRAMVMLKQSIECAMASFDQTFNADTGTLTGGITAGIRKLVDQNNAYAGENAFVYGAPSDLHYAPAAACVAEGTLLADGLNMTFIENALKALRISTLRNGEYWWNVGLGLRAAITGLIKPQPINGGAGAVAGQTTMFTQDLKDTKLGKRIDVVYTDYGTLLIKETDFIGTTTTDVNGNVTAVRANRVYQNKPNYGLMISRDKLALRFGVGFQTVEIGPDGGSKKKVLRTYCGVMAKNPQGFGFQAFG